MRLVATYLVGVAIGLVLLGLWQQARQRGRPAQQPAGEVEQSEQAPAPSEAPPPGPVGAP